MNFAADPETLHPAVVGAMGRPERFLVPKGARVVLARPRGTPVYFVINNRDDRIHKAQLNGRFYEQEVLDRLARHLPAGGVFVDIGANIGNHTLYMARHSQAARIIPMEPNPAAISLLAAVVRLNQIEDKVELGALGYGIGDREAEGYSVKIPKGNLGWTRIAQEGGDLSLRTGDSLLAHEERVDLIKIDVEGMEVAALSGLGNTLRRHRPALFVEVDHTNKPAFDKAMSRLGYELTEAFPRTRMNQNFLMAPVST
ncbi:MAG: FkbM family methyltransferase [Rhodobacter sp.]|nr:FkbM family methyltransferase [Rhodobacter sp.]